MVSTVSGVLRADVSTADVLRATFPCGSVTGAPKVAAMRLIEGLERSPRKAYTGALIVAVPGELDSSVLIRTAEMDSHSLQYGTGGGITFESDPHEEWLETLTKAVPVTGDSGPGVTLRETCRVVHGRVPLWIRHKARLGAGGCGPALLAEIEAGVAAALGSARAQADYARLALTVSPDGLVHAALDEEPSVLHVKGGPSFQVTPVIGAPPLPQGAAKPADRTPWDAAMREVRKDGFDQAVLADTEGAVIDGGTASVWVAFGERVFTPPAPPAIAGVARGLVLDLGHRVGLRPEVAHLRVEDLTKADEVIFTSAVAGPVAAFGQRGRATEMMKELFTEAWGADYDAASPAR
jgi:para-aminobenzoate synthetase/4-amino-4-deoxychorismate lyase